MTDETLSKYIVDASFIIFVDKYIEFCNSKILNTEVAKNPNTLKVEFVEKNLEVVPLTDTEQKINCLDGLNDVSEIIEKLFESEETFIKAMNSDIDNFNKLYNCFQFGNLEDPGHPLQEVKKDGGGGSK